MRTLFSELGTSILAMLAFTALTGLAYPACITLAARTAMPHQAHGSLVERGGVVIGSRLIGEANSDPAYVWPRPSATTDSTGSASPYNAAASAADNLGPANPDLASAVRDRVAALRAADPENRAPVPIDLVTASASGLDPDLSPAAALYQAPRIARARGIPVAAVEAVIADHISPRLLGLFGDPHVNVLELDLALDAIHAPTARR